MMRAAAARAPSIQGGRNSSSATTTALGRNPQRQQRRALLRRRPVAVAPAAHDAAAAAAAAASSSPPAPPPAPQAAAAARIEFPPSTVVSKADGYDLRLYQPYPVVRTEYEARPPAFLALGEYLGGANAAKARFARPEPAIMWQQGGGGSASGGGAGGGGGGATAAAAPKKTMELFIGSRRDGGATEESPPAPDDPSLTLDVSGGELVAVATFGGNLTREAAEGAHAALRQAIARDGLVADDGRYRACQYGAIHSLGERRNEVWVRIKL
jgi:hypothetical protein